MDDAKALSNGHNENLNLEFCASVAPHVFNVVVIARDDMGARMPNDSRNGIADIAPIALVV